MTAEPTIRPLRSDDLPRLVELCAEHAAFERAELHADDRFVERLRAMALGDDPRLWVWVADDGTGAVGYASFSREASTWRARDYLHLDCVYLRPEARNLGLGRRLLERVTQEARRLGIDEIQWQTPAWNRDAVRFYERLGAVSKEKLRFTWPRSAWPRSAWPQGPPPTPTSNAPGPGDV